MTGTIVIRAAEMPRDQADIARLCWAYRNHLAALGPELARILDRFYPLDSYDTLIASLPEKHARPKGSILLAVQDGTPVGCGMIQPLSDQDAEIKRVFVDSTVQGGGTGEALSRALIEQARKDDYARILLDTTRVSTPARRLYEKLGFQERGPYSDMPADVLDAFVFYELMLRPARHK